MKFLFTLNNMFSDMTTSENYFGVLINRQHHMSLLTYRKLDQDLVSKTTTEGRISPNTQLMIKQFAKMVFTGINYDHKIDLIISDGAYNVGVITPAICFEVIRQRPYVAHLASYPKARVPELNPSEDSLTGNQAIPFAIAKNLNNYLGGNLSCLHTKGLL